MKKRNLLIALGIIILLLIGIYFIYMQYFNGEIEEGKIQCDAKNHCPSKMDTCVLLPENDFPTCEQFTILESYSCPEGTNLIVFESYPYKILCQ